MKRFSLTIPEPCHENWDAMTRFEKGRHCASCRKTVIDFSQMSDRQLIEFIKKAGNHVCGNFYPDQLNRQYYVPGKKNPRFTYFLRLTWPALLFFLKSCKERDRLTGTPIVQLERILRREKLPHHPPVPGKVFVNFEKEDMVPGKADLVVTSYCS